MNRTRDGEVLHGPGVDLWFETEDETHEPFAHVRITDGWIFGKAAWLRQRIPVGTWISVGRDDQQPAVGWYLERHVGCELVTRLADADGVDCDIYRKVA